MTSFPLSALHWRNHQQAGGLLCGWQSRGRGPGPSVREQDGADCGQGQWAQKLSGRAKKQTSQMGCDLLSIYSKILMCRVSSYLSLRCYMLTVALLASTAPFWMASAMSSCRETLLGLRTSGILHYSGWDTWNWLRDGWTVTPCKTALCDRIRCLHCTFRQNYFTMQKDLNAAKVRGKWSSTWITCKWQPADNPYYKDKWMKDLHDCSNYYKVLKPVSTNT